MAVNIGGIHYK